MVEVAKSVRSLGVTFNSKRSFTLHVRKVSNVAEALFVAIFKLMPNIDGPSNAKDRLMSTVVVSKLLYELKD